jgi:hypothetical protein
MKTSLIALVTILILGLGIFILRAGPPSMETTPHSIGQPSNSGSSQQQSQNAPEVSQLTTSTHSIDWVSVSPSSVAVGAGSAVMVTAQITDPAVIRSSVNLILISPTGTAQIIGTLNDNGVNGDAVAGDNVFTIRASFAQYQVGTVNFRISAAFSGSLLRTQSGLFSINILPAVQTAGWVTLTDSQQLFSVQVPSTWGLIMLESPGDDPSTIKNVHFELPDGTIVFTIGVFPTSSWADITSGESAGPEPTYLGQNSNYVFGESGRQVPLSDESVSDAELSQTLPVVFGTFKAL